MCVTGIGMYIRYRYWALSLSIPINHFCNVIVIVTQPFISAHPLTNIIIRAIEIPIMLDLDVDG